MQMDPAKFTDMDTQCTEHSTKQAVLYPVAAALQAWQTVAAEYYDPHGHFSQKQWAFQLLTVLKAHDGALRTRADTYKALTELVATLGDKYSTFLDPSVSTAAA
jgi:hypothetical protein